MTDLTELIDKLQAATKGSRELDAQIWCGLNPSWFHVDTDVVQHEINADLEHVPANYTTGPEGLGVAYNHLEDMGCEDFSFGKDSIGHYCVARRGLRTVSRHKIPEIAAWIAILTAMQEGE